MPHRLVALDITTIGDTAYSDRLLCGFVIVLVWWIRVEYAYHICNYTPRSWEGTFPGFS